MQIAASAPHERPTATRSPADVVEHELSIYRAQAAESGKPEAIQQKMAEGRLEKFYKEVVLTEQVFVKNPDITVEPVRRCRPARPLATRISVVGFERFVLGETAGA